MIKFKPIGIFQGNSKKETALQEDWSRTPHHHEWNEQLKQKTEAEQCPFMDAKHEVFTFSTALDEWFGKHRGTSKQAEEEERSVFSFLFS
ncbi:hypothetical protein AVEN_29503-1 [Araneus ventricosus]|uniref:Uncharacterized protein n=1 Tax=Araneus ventricosus TaxID=182803 RepID=A0A4Y2K0Y1_ARAVE|nr:hypothetical protein AVEN_29503-1 [Araneus ventricosus]